MNKLFQLPIKDLSNKMEMAKINPRQIFLSLLSLLIFSQVPASFISYQFGIDNHASMIILRGLILLISLATLIKEYYFRWNFWELSIVLFWSFYIIRLSIDILIYNISTAIPPWELYAWSIGSTLIPSLAIYAVASKIKGELNSLFLISFGTISLGTSLLLFSINFNPYISRFSLENLNSIPAGHAGASLFLISFCYVLSSQFRRIESWKRILPILGILIGIIVTLSSSTRSAFIALLLGLIFASLVPESTRSVKYRFSMLTVTVAILTACYSIFGGSGLIEKLQTLGQGESELNRIKFISSSLEYWYQNPILGIGFKMHSILNNLFVELDPYYPHNFIVESLLIGGIVLCLILLIFLVITTWNAIKLIRLSKSNLWLVCLWLQAFIYVMVSGHLGNVPLFWFTSAAICGRYSSLTKQKVTI